MELKDITAKIKNIFKPRKKESSYISARESARISRQNRKITKVIEKRRKEKKCS